MKCLVSLFTFSGISSLHICAGCMSRYKFEKNLATVDFEAFCHPWFHELKKHLHLRDSFFAETQWNNSSSRNKKYRMSWVVRNFPSNNKTQCLGIWKKCTRSFSKKSHLLAFEIELKWIVCLKSVMVQIQIVLHIPTPHNYMSFSSN